MQQILPRGVTVYRPGRTILKGLLPLPGQGVVVMMMMMMMMMMMVMRITIIIIIITKKNNVAIVK